MQHYVLKMSFRFLIIAFLSLNAVLAQANTCNLGLGGDDGGIGGTGILSQGVGGTGISSDDSGEATGRGQGVGGTGDLAQGVGGTGAKVAENGLGGTGISPNSTAKLTNHGQGIGGTGSKQSVAGIGGTGIVGVITGFASICVNGVEAHYDSNTLVDINGMSSSIDNLNIGQLVAVEAIGQGSEVKAQRVSVIHALVGRVDEVSLAKNQIKVMHQVVQLTKAQGANNFKPGLTVAVSGLVTSNGVLRATRVDVMTNATPSSVTGAYNQGRILGVPVTIPGRPLKFTNMQVSGQWDGKSLKAADVRTAPIENVMRAGNAFDLQGVLGSNGKIKDLQILGKPVVIGKDVKVTGDKTLKDPVVIVRGQISRDGKVVTRELEYRPFDKILERGGSRERPSIDYKISKESKENRRESKESKETRGGEKLERDHVDNDNHDVHSPEKVREFERGKRVEKHDRADRPDRVEKLEKVEKVEKVERAEKVEHIERVERVEREDHVERDHD